MITVGEDSSCFERLDEADLLLVIGLHWTGWPTINWHTPGPYLRPTEAQQAAVRRFVASGRPVGVVHGGMASYDEWPEFGQLLGFHWHWDITNHSRVDTWTITPSATSTLVDDPSSFEITDELYGHVQLTPGLQVENHLSATIAGLTMPLLLTAEGGRVSGAGRCAWFGLGHDMQAWDQPRFRPLLLNLITWLCTKPTASGDTP